MRAKIIENANSEKIRKILNLLSFPSRNYGYSPNFSTGLSL